MSGIKSQDSKNKHRPGPWKTSPTHEQVQDATKIFKDEGGVIENITPIICEKPDRGIAQPFAQGTYGGRRGSSK